MKNILKNLADLIKVKTIVTFAVMLVYAVLALRGDITPENVQNLTMVVVAFYFGSQLEKKNSNATMTDHACPYLTETTENIETTEKGGE